jgi:hypothetical protein
VRLSLSFYTRKWVLASKKRLSSSEQNRPHDSEFQVKTIGTIVGALCLAELRHHLGLRCSNPAMATHQRLSDSMGG